MKTNLFKIAAIVLVVAGGFYSCNESNSPKTMDINTFLEQLKSAPYVDISKEGFPEWLVARINDVEKYHLHPIR